MRLNWKDISTYSKKDRDKLPKTWELKLEELNYRVIVTRHIYYKDTWLLNCRDIGIEHFDLKTDDIDEAKNKALKIIENHLNDLVKKILKWYIDMNEDGTPHTNEEIERVERMISELNRLEMAMENKRVNNDTSICDRLKELVKQYEHDIENLQEESKEVCVDEFIEGQVDMLSSIVTELKELLHEK